MLVCLRSALRCKTRRFVEDECVGALVDHHISDELLLLGGQVHPLSQCPCGTRRNGLRRRDPDLLTGLDPVARNRALAGKPKLSRPSPARDEVEADLGHVPFEPAIEPDSVVIFVDGEGACFAHSGRISES